jgi:histidine ammonia-lyase
MHALSCNQQEASPVLLNGDDLSIEQLALVARRRVFVSLTNETRLRMRGSRKIVEYALAGSQPVYGLNTDVGPLKRVRVPEHQLEQFQARTVAGHSFAFGTELDTATVRAIMLTRINGFAKGGAGVRVEVAEKLIELLNKQVHPVVVSGTSVGESDLSEMAQIAQVLVGSGEAEYAGRKLSGAEALNLAGIAPLKLAAKEALALISANGLTLGQGSLVIDDATKVMHTLELSAALALEGFGANLSILDPAASKMKAHPGLKKVSSRLHKLLSGSYLWNNGAARNLQDPLSFRCVPHVHGALDEALDRLKESMEIELNSASDNPLVNIDEQSVVSVGNFDITNIAIAFDTLRIAMIHVINLANERVQKQLWSEFSGMATGLERADNPLTRLIPLSRALAALAAHAQTLATPASLACKAQVGEGIEDHASAAPLAVTKTAELIEIAQKVACLELLISTAAIQMRGNNKLGAGTQREVDFIKSESPLQATNWNAVSERVLAAVARGEFSDLLHAKMPSANSERGTVSILFDRSRKLSADRPLRIAQRPRRSSH